MQQRNSKKFKCTVPPCPNAYYNKVKNHKHFFAFPADPELRQKWFDAINENYTPPVPYSTSKSIYLCEDHFETRLFTSTLKKKFNLRSQVVPTIFNAVNKVWE